MSEMMIIEPKWRNAKPFAVYRNPDARDRREIFADEWRDARFVLTGAGDLIVGRAHEFLHGDTHSHLTALYESNFVWSGELILAGPRFPHSFGMTLSPAVPEGHGSGRHRTADDPHRDAEYNAAGTVCLARMSHHLYRDRGFLDQSYVWRRFIRGLDLGLPAIEPIAGFRVNEEVTGSTRAKIILHGDGHLYFFDHDTNTHECEDVLQKATEDMYPGKRWGAGSDSMIGVTVGGNGNLHFLYSEGAFPIKLFRDNMNVRKCFGVDFDFETTQSEIAIAQVRDNGSVKRADLPTWTTGNTND